MEPGVEPGVVPGVVPVPGIGKKVHGHLGERERPQRQSEIFIGSQGIRRTGVNQTRDALAAHKEKRAQPRTRAKRCPGDRHYAPLLTKSVGALVFASKTLPTIPYVTQSEGTVAESSFC